MNKRALTEHVAQELATSRLRASVLVDAVLDGIKEGLVRDQYVTLTGFGTFEVRERKARLGRNPLTGDPLPIEAGQRVGFRVGKGLKESVCGLPGETSGAGPAAALGDPAHGHR